MNRKKREFIIITQAVEIIGFLNLFCLKCVNLHMKMLPVSKQRHCIIYINPIKISKNTEIFVE